MSRFIAGLSRGFAKDYTSLVILETFGEYEINKRYSLRHLERFKGISSGELAEQVVGLMNKKPFNQDSRIVLDATCFRETLINTFRKAKLNSVTVAIVEDDTVISEESNYRVSKKELIANLQFLFVAERLRMKPDLPLSNIITKELLNHRLKENFQDQDGLILALALACWYGQEVSRREVRLSSR